jgi:hypothetical protein
MAVMPLDILIAHKAINLSTELSNTDKRVAAVLLDHFNRKTGQCDPGQNSIAELAGMCRRSVVRSVGRLVNSGMFRKVRHGGHYHRNQYEPVWASFRRIDETWSARRRSRRQRRDASNVSRSEGHTSRIDGDIDVHQTLSTNSSNETLVAQQPAREPCTAESAVTTEGLSKEVNRKESYVTADKRFHVKAAGSQDAARDGAERRWNEALMKQFLAAPDVFGSMMEAIDAELSSAATDAELRKRGSGIHFLLRELDRRSPLAAKQRAVDQSKVPSGEVDVSGNSDREGSPASPGFESLNSTKHQPKHGA